MLGFAPLVVPNAFSIYLGGEQMFDRLETFKKKKSVIKDSLFFFFCVGSLVIPFFTWITKKIR